MTLVGDIIIIFSAFAGFLLAAYLNHKKQMPQETFVCPLKGNCAAVIHSEFSHFFGMPVEWVGMAYYLGIAVMYGLFLALPLLLTPATLFLSIGVSAAAFLFSAYLTFIQLVTLKQICTWCLTSAALSTIIFLTAIVGSNFEFVPLLETLRPAIVIMHLLGVALGVGGATLSNVLFFKFLRDLKISHHEAAVMRTISQVVWFGLALLVLSGAGLFLAEPAIYLASSEFLTKLVVVTVLIVNSAFLNLKISPHLVNISFGDDPTKTPREELRRERRIAFAMGGISIVSWYTALILGALPSLPWSVPTLLLIYAGMVTVAMIGSQVMERRYGRQLMV